MSQPGPVDSFFARWLVLLFDCLGYTKRSAGPAESLGVERELNISHHQPHLVPPMKLVFYDEMPTSPAFPPASAHRVSHWVAQGRDLASKASDRASLTIKRKLSKQNISLPTAVADFEQLPLRRQHFRPLELSIYLPGNRLSDLPEFQHLDFTSEGKIQMPPKALIRARSEDTLQSFPNPQARPVIAMVGEKQLDYWHQRATSSTTQRPPSACEALNSHPVYWHSLPGLPAADAGVKTLSPMVEEEEEWEEKEPPTPTLVMADSMMLEFPPIQEAEDKQQPTPSQPTASATITPPLSIHIPTKKTPRPDLARLTSLGRTRVSHWLSRSSSTTQTTQTTHYIPLNSPPPPPQHQHQHPTPSAPPKRNPSLSTLASSTTSPAESLASASMTSMTTAPTVHSPRSRSGTVGSLGRHVTVVGVGEESRPEMPGLDKLGREGGGDCDFGNVGAGRGRGLLIRDGKGRLVLGGLAVCE